MQIKIAVVLVALLAITGIALATSHDESAPSVTGKFINLAYLYARQAYPVNPTSLDISITRHGNRGTFFLHIRNPNTTCVTDPDAPNPAVEICGGKAVDAKIYGESRHGDWDLASFENVDNDQNLGSMTNVSLQGVDENNGRENIHLQYKLDAHNKGPVIFARVLIRQEIFGMFDKHTGIFDGYVSLMGLAYISGNPLPYQMVTGMDRINSTQTIITLPYRALTGATAAGNTTTPVAPIFVFGTLKDVDFRRGVFHAIVSIRNIPGTLNIVEGELIANYQAGFAKSCYHLSVGVVNVASLNKSYMMDQTDVCLD